MPQVWELIGERVMAELKEQMVFMVHQWVLKDGLLLEIWNSKKMMWGLGIAENNNRKLRKKKKEKKKKMKNRRGT